MKDVESKIVTIRNERVILDCDVAALYGVPTKEINQAVRNNPEKFPAGYTFQTTNEEKKEVVKNFDHLEKLNQYHRRCGKKILAETKRRDYIECPYERFGTSGIRN